MRCPICNAADTKVVDSRLTGDGIGIRRRRECEKCGHRFSTVERVELLDFAVVKRDGRREMYRREKAASGLRKALEKRPYTEDQFQKLLGEIERDILRTKKDEITSREIGEIVMNRLKHFDKVAYIRFASVYRSFEDVDQFAGELAALLGPAKSKKKKKKVRS
jgi:transcriptional repressor NrdR